MTPKAISDVNRSERIEQELIEASEGYLPEMPGVSALLREAAKSVARLRVDAERYAKFRAWWFEYWAAAGEEDAVSQATTPAELDDALDAATAPKQVADSSGRAEEEGHG